MGPWESLLGHFNSFWASVELGARRLPNDSVAFNRMQGPQPLPSLGDALELLAMS